jgi:UV DNA damage endonuclease
LAFATWGDREPYAHLSSPRDGWESPNPRAHADYIDPADFPEFWLDRTITVDVEAKAKERAVLALKEELSGVGSSVSGGRSDGPGLRTGVLPRLARRYAGAVSRDTHS